MSNHGLRGPGERRNLYSDRMSPVGHMPSFAGAVCVQRVRVRIRASFLQELVVWTLWIYGASGALICG
jgi:hypothetical protein